MARLEKKLLGQSLINANLITEKQLDEALKEQRKTGQTLGYILMVNSFISQSDLMNFFESKLGIPYANLTNYVIDPEIVKIVPYDIAFKYKLIPLLKVKSTVTVAMIDPLDSFVIDSIKYTTACDVKPLVSTQEEIEVAIEKYYNVQKPAKTPEITSEAELNELQMIANKLQGHAIDPKLIESGTGDNVAPVIKLVNLMILKAIADGASDIHIEPSEKVLRTRYRVDGILHEVMTLAKSLEPAVISRIKVMSNMDISEKRVPQDGRAEMKFQNRSIDLRVSSFPCVHGEKIVIRILDKTGVLIPLEDLGFAHDVLEKFKMVIRKPNGIILVTGPTGSGKSTTLYASLDKINSMDKNIVTIEDPVEYELDVINQAQINVRAGFNFANGLRSILRQDPDIVMVGEIRDVETAEIAIRAALTGHMVFSTLHTNDASGAVTRLIDMKVEPFLISSSLLCIMAQRLIRRICSKCKTAYKPSPQFIDKINELVDANLPEDFELYRGVGCPHCKQTGFKGRTTINELLIPNEKIHELIVNRAAMSFIKKEARKNGMKTLREDGIFKVIEGMTTIEEVIRVTQTDES
ncbi:MAG TPA: ATPase, T2SS/T4P/T4SS family [Candidatus Wallbacteria bacterium]|nr:ATPase, T2SS/T4P/T4SS family [Candidatus Wallbacteria bacterium]